MSVESWRALFAAKSPTFDGNPRLIRGYIAVEGYVMGDGTLVLDEAPFAVKHS